MQQEAHQVALALLLLVRCLALLCKHGPNLRIVQVHAGCPQAHVRGLGLHSVKGRRQYCHHIGVGFGVLPLRLLPTPWHRCVREAPRKVPEPTAPACSTSWLAIAYAAAEDSGMVIVASLPATKYCWRICARPQGNNTPVLPQPGVGSPWGSAPPQGQTPAGTLTLLELCCRPGVLQRHTVGGTQGKVS